MKYQERWYPALLLALACCVMCTTYANAQSNVSSYTIEYKPHDGDKVLLSIVITDMNDIPLEDASVTVKGAVDAVLASGKSDEKGKCQITLNKEQWSNQCLFMAAEVIGYGKRVVKMQYNPGVYLIHFLFTPHEGFIVKSKGT